MFVWVLLILNQTGTLGCVEPSTGQWCGECGRKVGQDFFIGVPTAMRRLWSQVLRYTVEHAKCFWICASPAAYVAILAVYTDSIVIECLFWKILKLQRLCDKKKATCVCDLGLIVHIKCMGVYDNVFKSDDLLVVLADRLGQLIVINCDWSKPT
jgi:hypothetical protein